MGFADLESRLGFDRCEGAAVLDEPRRSRRNMLQAHGGMARLEYITALFRHEQIVHVMLEV